MGLRTGASSPSWLLGRGRTSQSDCGPPTGDLAGFQTARVAQLLFIDLPIGR